MAERRPKERLAIVIASVALVVGTNRNNQPAGLMMRLTAHPKGRALLNDATLYLHAVEGGCVVLTRNLTDFNVFHQLVPTGHVLFYRQA